MTKTEEVLETVSSMTVLEISELVKAMEEKFGVTAAAPVMAVSPQAGAASEAETEEEQTEFDVILKGFGEGKKIPVIKEVRAVTGLGLKETKEIVESGDKLLKEGVSKEEAASIKKKLETAGATVEIK